MKPPNIILLTPNGRFETNTKICLSISGHHPESWQPSWSIRTALLAIIGFMPTSALGSLGSLNYTPEERKLLAKKSHEFSCDECGNVRSHLATASLLASKSIQAEAKQLAAQIEFKEEKPELSTENETATTEVPNASQESESTVPPVSVSENVSTLRSRQRPEVEERVEDQITQQENERSSNTSNIFICLIVVAIVLLLYRRVFVIPIDESLR